LLFPRQPPVVVDSDRRVDREIDLGVPPPGELDHGREVPIVPGRDADVERQVVVPESGDLGDHPFHFVEEPRDAAELAVPPVGKVERDRELIDTGLPQLPILVGREGGRIGYQYHPGQTTGLGHGSGDLADIAVCQRLAAGDVDDDRAKLSADRCVFFRPQPLLAFHRPAPVAVPAVGGTVVGDLERDREGALLEGVA
jgi:hypothetical protein